MHFFSQCFWRNIGSNWIFVFVASALSNSNATALQASLASGLGANLATNSLLSSSLSNELASNLNNFGGSVGLSNLQASLASQGNNSFAPRGLSKLDGDSGLGFGGNNAFGNSNYGGNRDFDNSFNRGDGDRVSGGNNVFGGNQNQGGNGNRQNSNGGRMMSDTIVIANVSLRFFLLIIGCLGCFKNSLAISFCSFHPIRRGRCSATNFRMLGMWNSRRCEARTWDWYDSRLNGTPSVLSVSFENKTFFRFCKAYRKPSSHFFLTLGYFS